MVVGRKTKLFFDPFFNNDFGVYQSDSPQSITRVNSENVFFHTSGENKKLSTNEPTLESVH